MAVRNLLALLLLSMCSVPASMAGVIVQVGDASISAGGSGFVDILISSDSGDNLDSFSLLANITGDPTNGSLGFDTDANQPDISLDASYVFFGNTGGYFADAEGDFDTLTFNAGDSSSDFNGVTLSGTPKLLVRVAIIHTTASPIAAVGDTFTISVAGSPDTVFADSSFNSLTVSTNSSGTVQIVSATVPEPGTFSMLCIAGLGMCSRCRQRRQQK
ncbi:PEP-CTERM sorting domain-containing protein [Rhodopirellula sp.]|nr:PEP-CTERM sorting domain-containing protein [Rhodopirellula sp.]MDB4679214.1 PEP-CTERM sorting domain-containing protein [Rhodopirellula sp.]